MKKRKFLQPDHLETLFQHTMTEDDEAGRNWIPIFLKMR